MEELMKKLDKKIKITNYEYIEDILEQLKICQFKSIK